MLHGNFVTAVLNDLFGIQARSGCFCAGPYVHRTFPIDDAWSERMDAEVSRGHVGAKLSFTRLGFNYFTSETVFDYILRAVHLVADEGWKLLPLYRFDPASGLWHHADGPARPHTSLRDVSFETDGPIGVSRVAVAESEDVLPGYLEEARDIIRSVEADPPGEPIGEPPVSHGVRAHPVVPAPRRGASFPGPGGRASRTGSSILNGPWRHRGLPA